MSGSGLPQRAAGVLRAMAAAPAAESLLLVSLLAGMSIGNWGAARGRTLIGTALDHRLVEERVLREKHPGEDDACFLVLDPPAGRAGRGLWVDCTVLAGLEPGQQLRKAAGERRLSAGGREISLADSLDARGMRGALPLQLGALGAALAGFALARRRRRPAA